MISLYSHPLRLLYALVALGAAVCVLVVLPRVASSQAATPITGWAWSDNIGWLSLNCSDLGTCGTVNYGISKAADGTLSGYAWSSNVGWVSANAADISACPTLPCTATLTGTTFSGWFRAIAGNTAQSGGWDGFISLKGSGYGVTQSGATLLGYAWGSVNVGWLSFSAAYPCAATSGYYCSANTQMYRDALCNTSTIQSCYLCAASTGQCFATPNPSGAITASPRLVHASTTSTIGWSTQSASYCTVIGTNGDSWVGTSSSQTSSSIRSTVTYTLSCGGAVGTSTIGTVTVILIPSWQEI